MAISRKTIFTGLFILLFVGCKSFDDNFSTYLSVNIPSFTRLDYNRMLSSTNDELIYNAIVNLIPEAENMGESLSKDCSDKKTDGCDENFAKNVKIASEIYTNISSQLDSENVQIVSVTVRFLNFFGRKYSNKNEIINRLLAVELQNDKVHLEVVTALSTLVTPKTDVQYAQIEKYLHSESWLVSRKTYELVNALENDQARQELMHDYASLSDETEQLLRLKALSNNYTNQTFEIYSNEILNSKNQKIKSYIFSILGNAKNPSNTLNWFQANYQRFKPEEINEIADNYYNSIYTDESEFGNSLYLILIDKGFNPEIQPISATDSTPKLFHDLVKLLGPGPDTKDLSEEELQIMDRSRKIDVALLNSNFSADWQAYKSANEIKIPPKEFIEDFNKNLENYFEQTKSTFKKHNVEGVDEYLKNFKDIIKKYDNGAMINLKDQSPCVTE